MNQELIKPENIVKDIIKQRQNEWDTLIAQMLVQSSKIYELKENLSSIGWDQCQIIGQVCERFGEMYLKEFVRQVNKQTIEGWRFTYYMATKMKHMYYTFLSPIDKRVAGADFYMHFFAVDKDNPFQILNLAVRKGWDFRRFKKYVTAQMFLKKLHQKDIGGIQSTVNKIAQRFSSNVAIFGVFLGVVMEYAEKYIEQHNVSQEVRFAIQKLKEFGNEQKELLPVSIEALGDSLDQKLDNTDTNVLNA